MICSVSPLIQVMEGKGWGLTELEIETFGARKLLEGCRNVTTRGNTTN
jgi:hypothetical protein